jgi:predicted ATPase
MRPLDRIEIKGFKSIRDMDLELGSLNILIGANGAGKTNFISAFQLLNQLMKGHLQVFVSTSGGANALLYFGRKVTDEIFLHLSFDITSYKVRLVPSVQDSLVFADELYWYKSELVSQLRERRFGSGHKEARLPEQAHELHGTIRFVLKHLQSYQVFHFHDTSESAKIKQTGDINDNARLRSDASNLAAFLYMLRETQREHYNRIVKAIRLAAPFFDDFNLRPKPENPDTIQLAWRERSSDDYFNVHSLSDGTLRFICLTTLLLQPTLPSTILIDEPELGLHPYAISLLASMLRSAATQTQVIVSTQSVTLVNQFEPEDIIVVDREEGESKFKRLEPQEIESWLEEYGLGDLWEKNILGGRPQR